MVTRIISAFFIISLCCLHAAWGQSPPGPSLAKYNLVPQIICTEIACPASNPCCNTCAFNGWTVENTTLQVQSIGIPIPNCMPDGCGVCPMHIKSYGYPDKLDNPAIFYATQWIKSEQSTPQIMNQEINPIIPGNEVNTEEQEKALKAWFGDLEKESKKNMDKMKNENPQQYQQMQQLINVFKNAGNRGNNLQQLINSN